MTGLIVIAAVAAFVLAVIVAAVAFWRTPEDWEPERLRKARQPGPIERFWDEVAAGDLREGQSDDDNDNGSD